MTQWWLTQTEKGNLLGKAVKESYKKEQDIWLSPREKAQDEYNEFDISRPSKYISLNNREVF